MKDGIKEILGKTVTGVIAKERAGVPQSQVFLVFSDNTWFELYCTDSVISGTGGLREGGMDQVRKYMGETSSIILDAQQD